MHPLIRFICFIIFAAFVSLGQYLILALGSFLLVLIWIVSKQMPSQKLLQMLKRMRVFYVSILIIYLWFTPGEIMFSVFDSWSPTYEGLHQAMERILALCLLVVAVETLLRLTSRNLILTGLYYLATPFVILGLKRDQFIVRLMLTLDLVAADPVIRGPKIKSPTRKQSFSHYFDDITQRIADKITDTINMKVKTEPMIFELDAPPNKLQWIWPVSLFFLFWIVSGSVD